MGESPAVASRDAIDEGGMVHTMLLVNSRAEVA
jgi:hypothetical protein